MKLSEIEKVIEQHLLEQYSPNQVKQILDLYLSIQGGKERDVSDFTKEELINVDILWEEGLIYYDSAYCNGKPIDLKISAIPFDEPEGGIKELPFLSEAG